MSKVDATRDALMTWILSVDPDARLVVMFEPLELAALHLLLAELQEAHEGTAKGESEAIELGKVRHRIEHALSMAGYGGDPRP